MSSAPPIDPDWSLFLDLDGTLLDIAPTPSAATAPPELASILRDVRDVLGGALAIVSGRTFASIDLILSPVRFAGGAEHGATIRHADGQTESLLREARLDPRVIQSLRIETEKMSGIIVEEKLHSVSIHYRLAPQYEQRLRAAIDDAMMYASEAFHVVPAKRALEIRQSGVTKGDAVRTLMTRPPFAGRRPVFVGDDITDEDGMDAARALGGLGLHVADFFGGSPASVRRWISQALSPPR